MLDKKGLYRSDSYSRYYKDRSAGVLGETRTDHRLNGKELVLGIDVGGDTKAYPLRRLERMPLVNDTFAGQDVLVFYDQATGTALAYTRAVDGKALSFRMEGHSSGAQTILVDNETTSTRWLAFTGVAIEGELEGKTLDRALSHLSFWFAWKDWNPDTDLLYAG